jgi:hypothetical protein
MKTVNIYTPTYFRFEKTKKAIDSIIESVNTSKNDVLLCVGDNNTKIPEMVEWLKSIASNNVKLFLSGSNVGKGAIINYMHEKTRPCDYFISIDSDMLADENTQYNWIDELVKLMEWEPAKNFGLLSTYQKENSAHRLEIQKEQTEFLGHFVKFGAFWGVAGGCIIMKNSDFLSVGRYNLIDIYSGDDALLMRNVDNKLKKMVGIVETIKLTHQHNTPDEEKYQQWKVDKCYGKIPLGMTKGFYDDG